MGTEVRQDDFDGVKVHTFARKGRPCWLLFEIERALREEVYDFDTRNAFDGGSYDAFDGEDFERLDAAEAGPFLELAGHPPDDLPVLVLYEGGLTLACGGSRVGHAIRRKVLKEAAEPIFRAARRARIEQRVRETVKQIELEDRARKAVLLHRLVEHARFCGPLLRDDEGYVTAMAIVAEMATGLVFPMERAVEESVAKDMGETLGGVRAALLGLCDELNT
jgi:hypothetical protein